MPALASMVGARNDSDRLVRNGFAGFATLAGFWDRGIENVPEYTKIANKIGGLISLGCSAVMDTERRRFQRHEKLTFNFDKE
ncbi:MAG: hypothetical protein HY514_03420 [Candidatus Aenigmarchaeota archaeon]|nr:hypothetical protein [Candidatus Aenigmarchaeota archaeon]